MKRLFTALFLTLSLPALAQTPDSIPVRSSHELTHSLEVFMQANRSPGGAGATGNLGLLYRKTNPRRAGYWMRGGAGFIFGNTAYAQDLRPLARDTAIAIYEYRFDRGALVFIGVERERRFGKNLFLFAAGELQGGYTTSRVDSSASLRRYEGNGVYNDFSSTVTENAYRVQTGFGGVQGSVGMRAYSKRVVVAVELLAQMRLGVLREREANVFDFSLGGIGYRTSIGYRF